MKSDCDYSSTTYSQIESVFNEYRLKFEKFKSKERKFGTVSSGASDCFASASKEDYEYERLKLQDIFKRTCESICSNEYELCNILIDLCYKKNNLKQFAWSICGETILKNLLSNSNNTIVFPKQVERSGEFTYCGKQFIMQSLVIGDDFVDSVE
jgi:2C-methyl-D-erythritol 2,4-cyclodiphosphate synthase